MYSGTRGYRKRRISYRPVCGKKSLSPISFGHTKKEDTRGNRQMSTYIRGFTEAKIDGKWHCIDFFQEKADGSMRLINCISGYGMVKHILDWYCNPYSLSCPPADLSDSVRKACTSRNGVLCGTDPPKDGCYWYVISGSWFKNADFSIPEYCGFFPIFSSFLRICSEGVSTRRVGKLSACVSRCSITGNK